MLNVLRYKRRTEITTRDRVGAKSGVNEKYKQRNKNERRKDRITRKRERNNKKRERKNKRKKKRKKE